MSWGVREELHLLASLDTKLVKWGHQGAISFAGTAHLCLFHGHLSPVSSA